MMLPLLPRMWCIFRLFFFSGNMSNSYDEALITACEKGHSDLIRPLVKAGASVNASDGMYRATLKAAVENRHINCIKMLISLGVDMKEWFYWRSIIAEDDTEVLQLLIEAGADVNQTGMLYDGPLEYACTHGHTAAASALLQAGASVNVNAERGGGPLIKASTNGHEAIVDLLFKFANDKNITILGGDIALIKASSSGYFNIVKTIVKQGVDMNSVFCSKTAVLTNLKDGDTALGIAVHNGQFKCVEALLNAGADVNHRDKYGWPILMSAATEGHAYCISYVAKVQKAGFCAKLPLCMPIGNHADRVSFLKQKQPWIKKHVDRNLDRYLFHLLDLENKNQTTTTTECYTNCVKVLKEYGADVNIETNGWTPLMVASLDGNVETVKVLLEAGAGTNTTTGMGWTPLITAVVGDQCDCARILIKAGADVNIEVTVGIAVLNHKKNALGFAVDIGNIKMVKLLLLSGTRLLGLKMANPVNSKIARLLIAAGYSNSKRRDIFIRPKNLSPATSLLLSDLCRVVIRRRLFELWPHVNLVYMVPKLGLPSLLQKYLLFGFVVEVN